MNRLQWLVVAAVMVIAAGCGDKPVPPSVAEATPTDSAVPTLTAGQVAESRRFREMVGLRADDLWIAIVAAEPSSQQGTVTFGVPLLPSESAQLLARTTAAVEVGKIIAEYGMSVPDDWHGSYIDQQRNSTIVVEVYRNPGLHRAALARLLSPLARWEVHQVDQRILNQVAFVERVKADQPWFATIDAELLDVVTNPLDGGIVELTYKSFRRDLGPIIASHYDSPEWLRVDWGGEPPWTGPVGDLVVLAVDAHGEGVPGLLCSLGGGTGLATGPDGTCRYPRSAARQQHIRLIASHEEPGYVAGSATFTVVAGRLTTIRIVVDVR